MHGCEWISFFYLYYIIIIIYQSLYGYSSHLDNLKAFALHYFQLFYHTIILLYMYAYVTVECIVTYIKLEFDCHFLLKYIFKWLLVIKFVQLKVYIQFFVLLSFVFSVDPLPREPEGFEGHGGL